MLIKCNTGATSGFWNVEGKNVVSGCLQPRVIPGSIWCVEKGCSCDKSSCAQILHWCNMLAGDTQFTAFVKNESSKEFITVKENMALALPLAPPLCNKILTWFLDVGGNCNLKHRVGDAGLRCHVDVWCSQWDPLQHIQVTVAFDVIAMRYSYQ